MKKSNIVLVPYLEIGDYLLNHCGEYETSIISRSEDVIVALKVSPELRVEEYHFEAYLDAYRFLNGFDVQGYYDGETNDERFNEDTFNAFDELNLAVINDSTGVFEIIEFDDSNETLKELFPDTTFGCLSGIIGEVDVWHDAEFLLRGLDGSEIFTTILKREDVSLVTNRDVTLYGNLLFASSDKKGDTIGLNEEAFETLFMRMGMMNVTNPNTKESVERAYFVCYGKQPYSI